MARAAAVRPLPPTRLMDTRAGADAHAGRKSPFETVALAVTGSSGVPPWAAAVVLNVTVTAADAAGFTTVWPCGEPRPHASTLNFTADQSVANAAVVPVPADERVCLSASASAHLVVDLAGWFPPGSVHAVTPARLGDTRHPGEPPAAKAAAFEPVAVPVAGHGGVAGDAAAAVVNVTVTEPDGYGFATVWGCGEARPHASNLNFTAGQTVANVAVVGLEAGGAVCVAASVPAHVVVDVTAWFAAGTVGPLLPARVLDTRQEGPRPAPFAAATVNVADRLGPPIGAAAAMLSVTVTEPDAAGFVTVWPCHQAMPATSNLNFTAGQTVAGAVLADTASGTTCVAASTAAHLVVDVTAWFPATPGAAPTPPQPPNPPSGPPHFAQGEAFWQPVPPGARLDPAGAGLAELLADPGAHRVTDLYAFGVPILEATPATPRHRLTVTEAGAGGWGDNDLVHALVPIPDDAIAASGSDGKLVVIDRAANRVYDLWQLTREGSDWTVAWGGVYPLDGDGSSRNPAYQGPYAVPWPEPVSRGTGSGISSLAGVVQAREIAQGVIPHALVFSTDVACGPAQTGAFRWPATTTDGWLTDGAPCIPQGARVQLDPSIDLERIAGITPGELAVGRALQTYGAYAIDNGGARMAFIFEVPAPGQPDPYPAAGLTGDYFGLTRIPWAGLRVLASWNGT